VESDNLTCILLFDFLFCFLRAILPIYIPGAAVVFTLGTAGQVFSGAPQRAHARQAHIVPADACILISAIVLVDNRGLTRFRKNASH